ncbi:hypothetical protein FISHEDRAFT_69654 [Fistulina hepatica ATCC 64428]|uniref:Uncharacterized protein n=1 Tax=Fistulina hepatica ATCC 64428 TaxID=1128425 RepID=A0A0D7AMW0_9AGAR|nr:hypothetical protein FISHEDRAFT_69654 [Fistulina hepatica ATCC 64428]
MGVNDVHTLPQGKEILPDDPELVVAMLRVLSRGNEHPKTIGRPRAKGLRKSSHKSPAPGPLTFPRPSVSFTRPPCFSLLTNCFTRQTSGIWREHRQRSSSTSGPLTLTCFALMPTTTPRTSSTSKKAAARPQPSSDEPKRSVAPAPMEEPAPESHDQPEGMDVDGGFPASIPLPENTLPESSSTGKKHKRTSAVRPSICAATYSWKNGFLILNYPDNPRQQRSHISASLLRDYLDYHERLTADEADLPSKPFGYTLFSSIFNDYCFSGHRLACIDSNGIVNCPLQPVYRGFFVIALCEGMSEHNREKAIAREEEGLPDTAVDLTEQDRDLRSIAIDSLVWRHKKAEAYREEKRAKRAQEKMVAQSRYPF